jgi:hypothetical protein
MGIVPFIMPSAPCLPFRDHHNAEKNIRRRMEIPPTVAPAIIAVLLDFLAAGELEGEVEGDEVEDWMAAELEDMVLDNELEDRRGWTVVKIGCTV